MDFEKFFIFTFERIYLKLVQTTMTPFIRQIFGTESKSLNTWQLRRRSENDEMK